MGVSGLLPFLAPIAKSVHLKNYSGCVFAVDTYVWLHRGAFSCAFDLCTGKPTKGYISYCMKNVNLLRKYGVEPYMVFDGGVLPMKACTEKDRKRHYDMLACSNMELERGNKVRATELFQQCVDVTPAMAYELIKVLQREGVQYVVAPYEADAQLAYLEKMKKVSAVLTEDSDLLVFGCQKVIVKLDANGNATEIRSCDFGKVPTFKQGWSLREFRHACILSGCDYLPSLKGVGLKKAFSAISEYKSGEKVIRNWKKWGKVINAPRVPPGYEEEFRKADMTFLHQRVFDPDLGKLVFLNPLPPELNSIDEYDYLGP
ncbi:PIN domain-like protein [Chytridium lagenaria]|nr:PIN domain-like protein [Chytridium lagenaria]